MKTITFLQGTGNKAIVSEQDGKRFLQSYDTIVLSQDLKTGELLRHWDSYSNTTGKHIKLFSGLNKAEYLKIPYKEI